MSGPLDAPITVQTRAGWIICKSAFALVLISGAVSGFQDESKGVFYHWFGLVFCFLLAGFSLGHRVWERMEIYDDGIVLSWSRWWFGPLPLDWQRVILPWDSLHRVSWQTAPQGPGNYVVTFHVDGRIFDWSMARWMTTNTRPAITHLVSRLDSSQVDAEVKDAVLTWATDAHEFPRR